MVTASRWSRIFWGGICCSLPAASAWRLCVRSSIMSGTADRYGQVDIVYGARSREDLVDYPEIVRGVEQRGGSSGSPDHRPGASGLGRSVGFVPDFVRSWALIPGRRPSSAAPHYDQIYLGGAAGAGFSKDAGVYHHGAADEMRHWKMRPVQHRRPVRL